MKMKSNALALMLGALLAVPAGLVADEQNGLSVNISRKTVDRTSGKIDEGSSGVRTKQQQQLRVEIKNMRLKALPPGEMKWTVLVKKRWEGRTKYTGTEVVPALGPTKTIALNVGDFGISTYRADETVSKDKAEYEVVITHEGKETYRFSTDSNFELLAKNATPAEKPKAEAGNGGGEKPKVVENDPKKMPPAPGTTPDGKPMVPGAPTPGTPGTPATAGNTAGTPAKPAAVEEPKVTRPPVDFFNLGGK